MKPLKIFLANMGRRNMFFPLTTPPMGIMALAAYLRSKFKLTIKLINQKVENYTTEELADQAIRFEPDIIGFTVLTTTAYQLNELTRLIMQALPDTLIILGGPHVSALQEKALERNDAHAAVIGEGELSLEEIIKAYLDNGEFDKIPGLIWRSADGTISKNPGQMPLIEDLDSLPIPAYDLIDLSKYWKLQSMPPVPRRKYISLLSSRGCPYQCIWCHKIFGKRFRSHSATRIVEEINFFMKKYGVTDVEFIDDIFNLDQRRVIDVADGIHKLNLKFDLALPNGVRGDLLSQEIIDVLADMNLYWCSLSLESGSPRLQEYIGKNLNIPKFLEGIEMLAKKRIFANGFAMMGFPTETEEELQMTIDTMTNSLLHTASFFTVMPFPDTNLYKIITEQRPELLKHLNYDNTCFSNIRINLSDVSDATLFEYQRKANLSFFLKPQRIFRILRDYPKPHLLPLYIPIFYNGLQKAS